MAPPYDDPSLSDEEAGGPAGTGAGDEPSTSNSSDETVAENTNNRENTQGQRSPTPADIADGRDDDVVARQIREAAEQEANPALREKLWEEYRKYKNNQ